MGEWIKKMWCISILEYYSDIKKENNAIFDNMDECGGHCAK